MSDVERGAAEEARPADARTAGGPPATDLPVVPLSVGRPVSSQRPPLTVRRSLVVVLASLVATVAVAVVGTLVLTAVMVPTDLGSALVPILGSALLAVLAAPTVVVVGVWGRERSRSFAAVYTAVLALEVVFLLTWVGSGVAAVPFVSAVGFGRLCWVLAPLLWSVPAAATGLVRARWVAYVAGAGLAVLVVLSGISSLA